MTPALRPRLAVLNSYPFIEEMVTREGSANSGHPRVSFLCHYFEGKQGKTGSNRGIPWNRRGVRQSFMRSRYQPFVASMVSYIFFR
jgi:hypothetical protein